MIPQRAFRGRDVAEEGQHVNVYNLFDQRVSSDNLAASAVMPISTYATTAGGTETRGGNIAWWPTSFSFGVAGIGTNTTTTAISHGLGRVPIGFFQLAQSFTNISVQVYASLVTDWNAQSVTLGVACSGAMTQTVQGILI